MATKTTKTKTAKTKIVKAEPTGYKREDIESILTNVLIASACLSAFLLTLTLFIAAVKH